MGFNGISWATVTYDWKWYQVKPAYKSIIDGIMSIITIDDVKYDDFESGESIGEDDDFTSKIGGKIGILLGYLVGLGVLKASDFHGHLKWMLEVGDFWGFHHRQRWGVAAIAA